MNMKNTGVMKYIVVLILFVLTFSACEKRKLEFEVPIQIVNNSSIYYSRIFEKNVKKKLEKRNFRIVSFDTDFQLILDYWDSYETTNYETVYDDCDYGVYTYELESEEAEGTILLMEGQRIIDEWYFHESNSEYLRAGDGLLIELFSNDEEEEQDCTEYTVKSTSFNGISSKLRSQARHVANDMVDYFNGY